jgi:hypothetical protein
MIDVMLKMDQYQRAVKKYEEMIQYVEPNVLTYNTLISYCLKKGMMVEVVRRSITQSVVALRGGSEPLDRSNTWTRSRRGSCTFPPQPITSFCGPWSRAVGRQ